MFLNAVEGNVGRRRRRMGGGGWGTYPVLVVFYKVSSLCPPLISPGSLGVAGEGGGRKKKFDPPCPWTKNHFSGPEQSTLPPRCRTRVGPNTKRLLLSSSVRGLSPQQRTDSSHYCFPGGELAGVGRPVLKKGSYCKGVWEPEVKKQGM